MQLAQLLIADHEVAVGLQQHRCNRAIWKRNALGEIPDICSQLASIPTSVSLPVAGLCPFQCWCWHQLRAAQRVTRSNAGKLQRCKLAS